MTHAMSYRRRGGRGLRLAIASFTTVLTAAPQAAAQQPPDREDQMLAFAQCMRENGYAEFPDPGPDGRLRIEVDSSAAPRFQAAQEACRDLSPMGVASGPPSPEQMERLLEFAQCMRDEGLAEFPDPNALGEFSIGGADVDMVSPQSRAAMDACADETRDGSRGLIRITP